MSVLKEQQHTAYQWVTEAAERIANQHGIVTERTVRGWLATGGVHEDVAEHLAALSNYGIESGTINAMVYALVKGRPMGDLEDVPAHWAEGLE